MLPILIFGLLFSPFIKAQSDETPLLQEITIPNLQENQTVKLMCALIQGENVKLEWYFNNKKLENSNRRKIKLNEESIDLTIKSLSLDDLGNYKCIAINHISKDEKEINLSFPVKPKFTKEPFDVLDSLAKEKTLECHGKAYPNPVVQWFKLSDDKQKVTKEFNSKEIKLKLTKENSGFYKCVIQNSIGSIEKIIKPIIANESNENKPILQEMSLPKNLNQNQVIRLNCDLVQGEQPLNFEWYFKNKKLENNNKTTIKVRDDSSDLIIKHLSADDLGDYKCKIKNSYGEDTQVVSLYTNVKPVFSKEPKDVSGLLSKEIVLECDVKSYPNSVIRWFKLADDRKSIVKEFKESNILKFNLDKGRSGFYRCVGENSVGSVEKIIKVTYYGKYE